MCVCVCIYILILFNVNPKDVIIIFIAIKRQILKYQRVKLDKITRYIMILHTNFITPNLRLKYATYSQKVNNKILS